jgi:hypothetical protein
MPEAVTTTGLSQLSRDQLINTANKLVQGYERTKQSIKKARAAAEKPAILLVQELAGVAGGALSGVVHGLTPTAHKFRHWDAVIGAPVMLIALAGAGSPAGDGAAMLGLGMTAPALSRLVSDKIHAKRGK